VLFEYILLPLNSSFKTSFRNEFRYKFLSQILFFYSHQWFPFHISSQISSFQFCCKCVLAFLLDILFPILFQIRTLDLYSIKLNANEIFAKDIVEYLKEIFLYFTLFLTHFAKDFICRKFKRVSLQKMCSKLELALLESNKIFRKTSSLF